MEVPYDPGVTPVVEREAVAEPDPSISGDPLNVISDVSVKEYEVIS